MGHYERLSALDAAFLEIEDRASHMHVAATLTFDAAPLRGADGGLDIERIRAYIESRLHLIPRYRQRLAHIPVEGHPVWVDDDRFNLFYHVRHTALPMPGSERQLKRLCGRIMSQKLDLTKPLWEIWVVEGLDGDRVALVAKAHHAMVDGVSGIDLMTVLLSPVPLSSFDAAPAWTPRPLPSPVELVLGEMWRRGSGLVGLGCSVLGAIVSPWSTLSSIREALADVVEAVTLGTVPASHTPLNPLIGPHRRFDWVRFDLGAVKSVKAALGGTVNDVVLASVTGAARRFLASRGGLPRQIDFRAMVPVSVRAEDQHGTLGNRVVNFFAALPLDEPDPILRYRKVVRATREQKESRVVRGAELIEELGNWTATALLTQTMRLATSRRAYNVVVTNIPGPQIPLYLLEAPMRASYPMVPLFANQAVGFALFSYDGGLYWGINADWEAVPDLHDLAQALEHEFDLLRRHVVARESAA